MATIGRWTARIVGTLLVLLFLTIALGEGLPAPSQLTTIEKLQFVGMIGLAAGLLLAWKWEGLGGVVGAVAFLLLVAVSRSNLRMWAFWLPAAVAVVHVACWVRLHAGAPAGVAAWQLPRALVVGALSVLGVFLLLCANEIFGQPPLMTPVLHPDLELQGAWRAPNTELSILPDARVSGTLDGLPVSDAQIRYGQSWFGRCMRFNSRYIVSGRAGAEAFTMPLDRRGNALSGSVFRHGRPTSVWLTRD
jgi:hypothetical protein